MTPKARHYRNEHVSKWVRALAKGNGSLLIGAHEHMAHGLFHLGAMWARERGYIIQHGTADVIGGTPRRYAYSLTEKGKRLSRRLAHAYRYDHHRAGMICDKCGHFVSDFL